MSHHSRQSTCGGKEEDDEEESDAESAAQEYAAILQEEMATMKAGCVGCTCMCVRTCVCEPVSAYDLLRCA